MRLLFGVLAVGMAVLAAGCTPAQSENPGPAGEAVASPTASSDSSLPINAPTKVETAHRGARPVGPTPTPRPPLYVPPHDATPIPRPFECEDHGYAGRANDGTSTVDTYWLTDPPEDPADAKFYVAQSICIAGMWIPPGNVQVWKADYSLRQLENWYDELRSIAESVPGGNPIRVNEGNNRLEFTATTPRAADLFERLLTDTSVPFEAVEIEVRDQMRIEDPPPNPSIGPGLELSLEFDQTVDTGDPIVFTLAIENTSDQTLAIDVSDRWRWWGSRWDIVIFTEDGDQIWRHNFSYLAENLLIGVADVEPPPSEIGPGESVNFEVEWDGLDDFRVPLEPGAYSARAFFNYIPIDSPYAGDMSTPPVPLQVLEP